MKAYEVKYYDLGDYSFNDYVVADSEDEAKAKVLSHWKRINGEHVSIVRCEEMRDLVTYNVRGTEMTTGIVLSQQWTSDLPEAQAKKDAKWIGKCFKSDNPQLYKKGQRANFRVDFFVSDSRVTVAERIEDYDNRATTTVIR